MDRSASITYTTFAEARLRPPTCSFTPTSVCMIVIQSTACYRLPWVPRAIHKILAFTAGCVHAGRRLSLGPADTEPPAPEQGRRVLASEFAGQSLRTALKTDPNFPYIVSARAALEQLAKGDRRCPAATCLSWRS